MRADVLERLDALLAGDDEADGVLRATTELLVAEPGIAWAGIAFLEDGDLVLGPAAGEPDESARRCVEIAFHGDPVGELRVDGAVDDALLEDVAARIAELVLVGWDTGGETWEP
jgi:putative methionine-R-sulfoxide reductase with GAF domain